MYGTPSQRMSVGPGRIPVRLGASTVAGNIASYAGPSVKLGKVFRRSKDEYGTELFFIDEQPVSIGTYYIEKAAWQDEQDARRQAGGSTTPAYQSGDSSDQDAEDPEEEYTADDWAELISAVGGALAPTINAVGNLINPQTGLPLTPEQIALYRRYEDAKRREKALPKWVLPVGIAAAVGLVAIVLVKK